eukprot:UN25112
MADGSFLQEITIPDTITSWVATGVSLNANSAMGIANNQELTTFKPFFVSMNKPYEVMRNEAFDLTITVFNYSDDDLEYTVEVLLPKSITVEDEDVPTGMEMSSYDGKQNQLNGDSLWTLKARTNKIIVIPISPTDLGELTLTIKAVPHPKHGLLGDEVIQTLLVSPEGVEQQMTYNA